MKRFLTGLSVILLLPALAVCSGEAGGKARIVKTGTIQNPEIDEASGLQASRLNPGTYFLHNDDGKAKIFAIDSAGQNRGSFSIKKATNRDWEDITGVPSESGPLLLISDSGDKEAQYKSVHLYFIHEPNPDINGWYSGSYPVYHRIKVKYPDGPRDCESIGYDPDSNKLLLLSKHDKPARLYSISLPEALAENEATLTFEGNAATFRPPTGRDVATFGKRQAPWVSEPTGMDFRPDGRQAAVITYRSLYLFDRNEGETWASAFARKPLELEGPPGRQEEAVAYAPDGASIIITSEGLPAPVYRIRQLPETP